MVNSPDDYGIPAAGIDVKLQRNVSGSHNGFSLYQFGAHTWPVHVTTALVSCRITVLLSSTTESKSIQCIADGIWASYVRTPKDSCAWCLVSHREPLLLAGMPPALAAYFDMACVIPILAGLLRPDVPGK